MQQHRHPQHARTQSPYPTAGTQITGFRYESALVLLRLKDAVKMRSGSDADYLTGRPYAFSWQSQDGAWHQITVPAGMVTDLTSVPWLFRFLVGRVGPWLEASILHDYLYLAWQDSDVPVARREDRKFADDMMLAAMTEARVSKWRRWSIHMSVTLFGGIPYAKMHPDRYLDLHDAGITGQICDGGLHLPDSGGALPLS